MLTILPAIDLMDGQCVRLRQGDYDQRTDYGQSPLGMAEQFERMGYKWLHIIDLDGARAGEPRNLKTIQAIVSQTSLKVQVGGGLRSLAAMERLLEAGVTRVMVGSMAVKQPEMLQQAIDRFGAERVVVTMDVRDGDVKISGWEESGGVGVDEFTKRMMDLGVTTMLCTDISRDGMMQGPNVELYQRLLQNFPQVNWIAAGGVGLKADQQRLASVGVTQAVVGKAFYEGSGLTKRVIPCLDIKNGRTVKGVQFEGLRDAGDPVELARRYEKEGADELVFLDITATSDKRGLVAELARKVAEAISIPFTVGGGIRSMEDIAAALQAGADKVSLESAAVLNPELVSEASAYFGSQAIVISCSPKRVPGEARWTLYVKGGREDTGVDLMEFLNDMQARGAGEILLNSIDEDGRGNGYDLALLRAAASILNIPLIASSGAGELSHFIDGTQAGADAVLAASIFHFGKFSIGEVKAHLAQTGVAVRQTGPPPPLSQ
jgi:cyclase